MVIRDAKPEDRARWQPLWDGYNAFYGRVGPTALPREITDSTWRRFMDPAEPVHALVAESDPDLVGLAHYLFHRSTIAIGHTCYLQDLFTVSNARGKGIGGALIAAVVGKARAAGASRLYWHTQESNAVARRLYDAVGENSGFIVYRIPLPEIPR
jgi:GNAT superfamily N-acetyltransferase